jgi:HAT1-interacting factor 1
VYKQELYPKDSEIIAEAHFKLSLALEFASITTTSDGSDGNGTDVEGGDKNYARESQVDEAMREEAAKQLELAIESTKLKLHNKEVELASTSIPEDNETTRKQIADVKEMVVDMEQRVSFQFCFRGLDEC